MGPREIGHRLIERLRLWRLRRAFSGSRAMPDDLPAAEGVAFLTADAACLWLPATADSPLDPAELLAGCWPALGYDWQWSNAPDTWRRAPDTGRQWPGGFFADIPYRAGNPVGDIRVAWEPARLQQLVALALFARHSDDGEAARVAIELLERQLLSWVRDNRPLDGIHYVSAMECGLRILSVCHAYDLARPLLARREEVGHAVLQLVACHAAFIEQRLSLHSSAGNHTVAECAGLIYAGLLFPELRRAGRWFDLGWPLLESELQRQILADGGGLEQAFWYLRFVADLGTLAMRLAESRHRVPTGQLSVTLDRAREFLAAMADSAGRLPPVGDSDDGAALLPGLVLVEQACAAPVPMQSFGPSGYTLLRGGRRGELRALVDHGPLGMPPSYGHGHADALALQLWLADREVLVDPGTFTYTGDPLLRRHFRSALAHNSIVVDGLDQACQETAFMWSSPFVAKLFETASLEDTVLLLARHDGYRAIGVTHCRGVAMAPWGLLVWDWLAGSGTHELRLRWNCAGRAELRGDVVEVEPGVQLAIDGLDELRCDFGYAAEPAALRSTRYGRKQEIFVIDGTRSGSLPHTITTLVAAPGHDIDHETGVACRRYFEQWRQKHQAE